MRTLVVTAADEGFATLLRSLVESLDQWQPRPFDDLACFDIGLAASTRAWIARRATHLVEPGWDLPVDETLRSTRPNLRALTVRPFLPRYFPGYDVYLWIDADAWVQERAGLEAYRQAALEGAMALVSHDHPAYRHGPEMSAWRDSRAQACFGRAACELSGISSSWVTYWNTGVFALAAGAPHWSEWSRYFAQGLAATDGKVCCDQTALNQAVAMERLAIAPLAARHNWLCHLALPAFDEAPGKLCDPLERQSALGILHLSGGTKDLLAQLRGDPLGRRLQLRYPPGLVSLA